VAAQQRGALRRAAQIAAARGAGEDGGEAVVADLHEQLGEVRCGREPRQVDVTKARAQPEDGVPAAKDEPRAGPDPAAPLAGVEHEDRPSLVRDQAAGANVRLVEETVVALDDEAHGLAARIDGNAHGQHEAARRRRESIGSRASSRDGEQMGPKA